MSLYFGVNNDFYPEVKHDISHVFELTIKDYQTLFSGLGSTTSLR
jgi:hypothetical protein